MASAEAQSVTLQFLSAERPDVYAPAIEAFEQKNPDIKIEYQQVPFDSLNAQVQARIGQGDANPDVYSLDTPRTPALAKKGLLMGLDDERQKIEAVADATAVGEVSYDDRIYGFPLWTSTQLLFYNRKLLEAAGVDAPATEPDQRITWKSLLDEAKKAQEAGAKWGFIFEQVDRYYQLQPLFESAGGGSGLTGDTLMTPALTTDPWISTAQWYGSLFADGISPRGVSPEQSPDLFTNGEAAFFLGGPWNFGRFNAVEDLDYGVALVPYFDGGKAVTPTGSWAVGINPNTAHEEQARNFAEFLSLDPEGSYLTVSNNPIPPVNAQAYKRFVETISAMTDKIGPAADIISYEIANTAVSRPRSIGYVTFEDVMNSAFADIRNGSDAQGTLDQAETRLKSSLARIR